ncbi:hypothetical protein [Rahnella woolbedingensis]|uniref:Uncharacterized protein n=1 Tax=Rahnella woolbedingensis TaxID=1510574 RepID=A0A419N8L6_9GAMM|nr:hypothetical protein [Rahnella woolbedingensis]RJT43791.1 hypothetical protein D6C13_12635 [Rahnella woolbedingensis]
MEWLAELLSLITKNPWAAGILGTLITALSGMLSYHLKERGCRRMKRYELTLEHYNDYSCQMFTAMNALCADKGFEKHQTRSIEPGQPELVLEEFTHDTLNDLLCASGRATLVADPLARERIAACTNCIIHKVNGKQQSSDDCHGKILEALRAMNQHLRRFEYWWLLRWGFTAIAWFEARSVKKICMN